MLKSGLNDFANGSNKADTAVKICRIDVNIAARNIREMALNDDVSSYAGYRQKVDEKLDEVGVELESLKETGLISDELYQKYVNVINAWSEVGYDIMAKIEAGEKEAAIDDILTKCVPALDELIAISQELDAVTDELMQKSVRLLIPLMILHPRLICLR